MATDRNTRRWIARALVVGAIAVLAPAGSTAAPGLPGCTVQGPAPRECTFVSKVNKVTYAYSPTGSKPSIFYVIVRYPTGGGFFCNTGSLAKTGTCATGPGAIVTLMVQSGAGFMMGTDSQPAVGKGCSASRINSREHRECTYQTTTGIVEAVGWAVPHAHSWGYVTVTRPDGSLACYKNWSEIPMAFKCKAPMGSLVRAVIFGSPLVIRNSAVIAVHDVPA